MQKSFSGLVHGFFRFPYKAYRYQIGKGRIQHGPAVLNLLSIKRRKILPCRQCNDIIFRREGLDDCFSGMISSPGTPYHLSQQRKGSLTAAKVIAIQGLIRQQHRRQCDIFKIQSLCHHLRSQDDVVFPSFKSCQFFFVISTVHCRIGIQPQNTCIG